MPSPATLRKHRLRMTKAQLIDQIDTLEKRAATIEAANRNSAPTRAKASDRYLANQERADLARFPSEDPNPVLRVMPDGTVLYANDVAIAVKGLFKGRKKSMLARNLAEVCAEASRTAEVQKTEFESADHIFAFSIAPIADETYINIYGRDITEHKRTKKALQAIDRRYQTIMANVPGVVYQKALHPDGSINFPYVSEGLRQTHGLDPEKVMRDPAAWLDTTHPDDHERLAKSNAESIEKLEDWSLEYRIVARDGTTKWVRGTSHIRHDTNDDVVWDGVLLDVTEEHLRQQRISDLAKFPSENPNPIVRVKSDGKVLYANNTARGVDGLIVGGKRSMLTRKLGKALDVVLHGGKGQEQEFTSGDRMFAFIFAPVPDESYINVYGREVTKEHRARKELVTAQETSVAAEALLRDAIDNISEGFVVYDSNGCLVTCNQKWKEIYGYSDEDATPGVKYEDLVRLDLAQGVIADQRGRMESYYKYRLAYRKEKEGEFEVELADGRWILIRERLTSSSGRVGIQADITERKRAEKVLRESEERYAMAMRAIDEGVYEWNIDTDEFYSSSGALDMLGLPVKEIESRRDFLERIHPDDQQRYRDAYVALLKGETERLNCDVRYRDSEGNWRGARQHAVAVRDENGRAHRVVGASGDITELMQREQALRDSREMLFAVVNAVPAMINAKDLSSRYMLINRYQAELYGTSEEEAIGKSAGSLLDRKYGAHTRSMDRKVITSGEALPYYEEDHLDAHGVHRKLLATKVPLKDKEQQVRGVVTVALDITERKRAETELRKSREQLQALADNLPEFISMKDLDGRFIFINKQFEEWVCQSSSEVIGKTVFDIYSGRPGKRILRSGPAGDRQSRDLVGGGRPYLPRRQGTGHHSHPVPGDLVDRRDARFGYRQSQHHRIETSRGGTGGEGSATPSRPGQYGGRHEARRSEPELCALQCEV